MWCPALRRFCLLNYGNFRVRNVPKTLGSHYIRLQISQLYIWLNKQAKGKYIFTINNLEEMPV